MEKFEIILLVFALWNFLGFFVWCLAGVTRTNGPELMVSPNSLKRHFYTNYSYFTCWVLAILINLACPLMFIFTFIIWVYDTLKKKISRSKK